MGLVAALLISVFGLAWPFLMPIMLINEYISSNPDSSIIPALETVNEFLANILEKMFPFLF